MIEGSDAYSVFKNGVPTPKASVVEGIESQTMSRRNLLRSAAALSTGALLGGNINPGIAVAADDIPTPVYFGVGVSMALCCGKDLTICHRTVIYPTS